MPKLSGVNYEKTKIEVAAVVGFNNAHGITYSKSQLANYFGVTTQSLRNWFPVVSSRASQPSQRPESASDEIKSPVKKRSRSEDPTEEYSSALSSPHQSTAPVRQNPVQNGGQGRKKLKMILEDEVSSVSPPPLSSTSSPPPQQKLLTPPRRKIFQPWRRPDLHAEGQSRGTEPVVGLKRELDEDIEV